MLAFRFDIDTRRGLVSQTPPLLQLLDTAGIRASFFCVMGREADPYEIVRYRLLADRSKKSKLNVAAKGGIARIALAALTPRKVGSAHPGLLRAIVGAGHELQPHGWSHIRWQRALDAIDVPEHLRRSMAALEAITGQRPDGFAAPGRSCNDAALVAYDAAGLTYAGDLDGTVPFRPAGHSHLQLPITRFETIAQMRASGLDDAAIAQRYLDDVDANPDYCCVYEHPDDLGPAELQIFAAVFDGVRARGIEPVTLREIAAAWDV